MVIDPLFFSFLFFSFLFFFFFADVAKAQHGAVFQKDGRQGPTGSLDEA